MKLKRHLLLLLSSFSALPMTTMAVDKADNNDGKTAIFMALEEGYLSTVSTQIGRAHV